MQMRTVARRPGCCTLTSLNHAPCILKNPCRCAFSCHGEALAFDPELADSLDTEEEVYLLLKSSHLSGYPRPPGSPAQLPPKCSISALANSAQEALGRQPVGPLLLGPAPERDGGAGEATGSSTGARASSVVGSSASAGGCISGGGGSSSRGDQQAAPDGR